MAGERAEVSSSSNFMDPCLYNSLPSLPPPESRDLRSPWSPSAHAPYSPSNVLSTPDVLLADPVHAADIVYASSSDLLLLADEHDVTSSTSESPAAGGNEPLAREPLLRMVRRDVDAQISIPSPSQPPSLRAGHDRVETTYAHVRLSELTARGNTLSAQHQLLQHPEYRFQRLLELLRIRRSVTEAQGLDDVPNPMTNPERLMHDIMQSHRALEAAKKAAEGEKLGDVENKKDDSSAANFECNICYELAKAPVVTPCGHLYCWSCLYQWLHAHSVNSECPVCKGQVLEVNVTPIYGRGGDETNDLKQDDDEESGLKIPPRPSANRIENLRPQLRQRLEEGIANSWRNNVNEDTHGEHRTGHRSSSRLERSSAARTAVRRRLARRMQQEEGRDSNSTGVGYPLNPPLVFHSGVLVPFQPAGLSSLSNSLEPLQQHRDSAGSVIAADQASASQGNPEAFPTVGGGRRTRARRMH